MTGQKLGGDDEQMVRVSGGSEESDQISSESNIIWNKFTKLSNKLINNLSERINTSKEVNEIELIDGDVEMTHIYKLIAMYGNF